jgi:succinyl-CoA synthetase beta subunit
MKIHEYQAKALLARYGVPVPRGELALTVEAAEAAAKQIGGNAVVKAQIHAGGRGKGGGVKIAASPQEAREIADKMLGMTLVTHQTGPEGRVVQRLLIEETLPIERELYLGIVLDRNQGKNVFMASADGGVDIEQVAARTPERILKEIIEPGGGLAPFQARKLAFGIGITGPAANLAANAMLALSKAADGLDASLAEINPFILTRDGKVYALDAKINLDDNAMFPGGRSFALRLELHQARRQRRLHGQRRGPGHGHHGYHQVRWRQSRQFPGRGRRRQCRSGAQRLPHPAVR